MRDRSHTYAASSRQGRKFGELRCYVMLRLLLVVLLLTYLPTKTSGFHPSSAAATKHSRQRRTVNVISQLSTRTTTSHRTLLYDKLQGTSSTSTSSTGSDNNNKPPSQWLFSIVLPLQLVYISNQWSRSSLYYLVNFSEEAQPYYAMNADIGFTQAQYGLLASVAFSFLFAIASLGAGVAADRFNRKTLTMLSALGWGTATLGTAFSTDYESLVLWRIAMGLACAFTTPTGYTFINDNVPEDRKSFATSLYGTGVALGGALASLSILMDDQLGWKQTTIAIGIFAVISSSLILLVLPNDDKKTPENDQDRVKPTERSMRVVEGEERSVLTDISQILSSNRVKWLFLGAFLRFSAGLSIGVWSASYYKLQFPENASQYAVAQAVITAVAGSISGLLGGAAADKLASDAQEGDDVVGQKLLIPVVASILAAPTFYMAIHAETFETAMIWLSIEYLVAECWFGPTISAMLTTIGSQVGGTGQGLFTLTGAFANVAPTAIGWAYGKDTGSQSSGELSDLLSLGVGAAYILCAASFAISSRQTHKH